MFVPSEWPAPPVVDSFYKSHAHFDLQNATAPFIEAPADIKLYETGEEVSGLFRGETEASWSLEITEIKAKDAKMTAEDAKHIFQKVVESSGGSDSAGDEACGISLNLEKKEIVLIRAFSTQGPAEDEVPSGYYKVPAEIAKVAFW
ncbi:hypothetical protein PG994_014119 [Apiospora phragmitis]|uniref:Uncharacterized protein n=1 Tax=Apiospora phragmitis TaxID=2905665 RepID=A0ABR1T3F6_9PEZI